MYKRQTFTTVHHRDRPDAWRTALEVASVENQRGAHLYPQVASRSVGLLSSLAGYHPFMRRAAYLPLAGLPVAERAAAMADPVMKAKILEGDDVEPEHAGSMEALYKALQTQLPNMYRLAATPDIEPPVDDTFAAMARSRGVDPAEAMYDFLVEGDGTNVASLMGVGYVDGNLDSSYEMLTHPATVVGLADAGAHVRLICDGSSPSTQLTHWTRDRHRGKRIPLEVMVEKQTRRNARLYGFADRGTIEAGMRADINVIDLDRLTVGRPVAHHDLPAGGMRYLQPVAGYLATFVNGVQTRENDADTGERPGGLIRG